MDCVAIYEFLTARGKLSDQHREDLKKRRGFTDETIAALRFFSGGQYWTEIEKEIKDNFSKEDLIKYGVFLDSGAQIMISPQLLDNRIVIPYLNKEGKAYFIRPHKLGLKDVGIHVYHDIMVDSKGIIITEGEFKAAACYQWGFPSIALPGVSSFVGEHFPRLLKILNDSGVRQACVIFDNEVKDDEKFTNYKPEPWKRHDTPYYAWLVATMLGKEGIECRIGMLPDGWRVDGKIDLDGALAQGKTRADIDYVKHNSLTPRNFLEGLPAEAQKIIHRKNQIRFHRSHIRREFSKYVKTISIRSRRGATMMEDDYPISNFVINILATHETREGLMRKVQLVNTYGEHSPSFMLSADDCTWMRSFKKACWGMGNFVWWGEGHDLDIVMEMESLTDAGVRIDEPDHIGWIEKDKIWLFDNVAFKDGREYRPDEHGIFWIGDKGFKPSGLGGDAGDVSASLGAPELSFDNFDHKEFLEHLVYSIGKNEARLCLGWAYSVFFMEDIFKMCGSFPFLFLHGKKAAGKSHVAAWIRNIFGIASRPGEEGFRAGDTTIAGAQRILSWYSSLPAFMDEYQNLFGHYNKDGLMRNAYNRQSAIKGTREGFNIRISPIRGTLIVAGQVQPRDSALLSRCINIQVTASNRDAENNPFIWFTERVRKGVFSGIGMYILRNKAKMMSNFTTIWVSAQKYLKSVGVDDRTAQNYASVAAGYMIMHGDKDPDFAKMIGEWVQTAFRVEEEQEESMSFWDDILSMKETKQIRMQMWKMSYGEENRLIVNFRALYALWEEWVHRRRGDVPFTLQALKNIIKNEKYCMGVDLQLRLGESRPKGCIEIYLPDAPDAVKALVEDEDGDAVTPVTGAGDASGDTSSN